MIQKGKVKRVGTEEVISEKFKNRTLVIDTEGDYPQVIEFQSVNDKCDLLSNLNEGQDVTVHFNLRGREWQKSENEVKVFNTLDLWKIETSEPF